MQEKEYKELFSLIQSLIGAGSLTLQECRMIHDFINQRLSEAYNTSQAWPRYLNVAAEKDVAALKVTGATTTTAVNQNYKVFGTKADGSIIYQGLTESTLYIYHEVTASRWKITQSPTITGSQSPYAVSGGSVKAFETANPGTATLVTDVAAWTTETGLVLESISRVPHDSTNIAEFLRIHRKKAFLNSSQREYEFYVDAEGANILNIANTTDNKVYVTSKKPLTLIVVNESASGAVSTDYTNAIQGSGDAQTNIKVPFEFFNFIANGAYADFLRVERRFEEAVQADVKAQNYLVQELEKLDIIANNNNLNNKFTTYINRNSR